MRKLILDVRPEIREIIKWNSPSYTFQGKDCITLRIQPLPHFQMVLHGGPKGNNSIPRESFSDPEGIVEWKDATRAVLTLTRKPLTPEWQEHIRNILLEWLRYLS